LNKNRLYWFCQLAGWGVYSTTELTGYFAVFSFSASEFESLFGNAVANTFAGITLTHSFKLIFKRYQWIKLPIVGLVARSLIGFILMTTLMAALNIPLDNTLINTSAMNWAMRDLIYLIAQGKPLLIWVLIYVFYHYTDERKNDEIERIKLQSLIRETESKVLRAQMNPHFMFNALNSIRALVLENPERAQEGITQLSNILRSSLIADRRKTVTLKEELRTVEDYLALEKVRYEERLQIKWDIAPETLSIQVPPMMLQTLVENAIKHGVQKALRWGYIDISAKISTNKQQLHLFIRNTGTLIPPDMQTEGSGFGLLNTQQRLQLLFGTEAHFSIYQENELTVCAEIHIPIH
jgi:sensor histidine kinase YesM